jgi:hypothetical protein
MRSKIVGLVFVLSSTALVAAGGCGGSSGGTGAAGQGGGGGGGSSGGAGTSSGTAGASGGAGAGAAGTGGMAGGAGATAGSSGTDGGAGTGAAGTTDAAADTSTDAATDVAAPFTSVTIPDMLAVPAGATLKFRAHGVGAQIYTCVATTSASADAGADGGADASVTTYAWGPATPAATLYDETDAPIGTHFAGPTWMSSVDGSDAVGSKVAQVAAPVTTAIPWLLLKVVEHMGTGVFTDVTYVQRLNTANGVAPATGCDATTVGMTSSVSYTADYYFYTGGVTASDGGAAPQWPFATVMIPDALTTPAGTTLKLKLHGWGAQIYTCTQSGGADAGADAGAATYAWGPATPSAKLYDDSDTQQGTHSAGPTWTATDTSSVVGTRLQSVSAPTTGSIPWLLLQIATHSGSATGVFSDVTYVQRLNTSNGVAPATGCDAAHVNMTTSSSYSADYYFYTGTATMDGGADASGG